MRLGYAAGRFMPYVTGGAAFGDIKTSVTGQPDCTSTKIGWTVGGGLEAALAGPWTAKLEYLYVDLGRGGRIARLRRRASTATSCGSVSITASDQPIAALS